LVRLFSARRWRLAERFQTEERMKLTRRSFAILLVLLSCGSAAFAGIVKGPYLMYEGSNTGMAVLWQTDVTESDIIRWGTDTTYSLGQASSSEYGDHQHKFVITGLQPGTKYYYQVDGYGSYGAGSFHTAPSSSATSVSLLAYGDTRSDPAAQERVVSMMRSAYAITPALQSLTLHSGDWVAGDTEADWTTQFFGSALSYPQIHAFQSEVPITGARGNHEGLGTVYRKYFPSPYVANFYWSFDYGPAHVIVLDEYVTYAPGSAQYTWLTNDLASTTKPWKILVSHEPGWSAGGGHANNTDLQNYIQPLCEQYGVDFVINGHNHYYSRAVVNGVQHITTGGGGAPLSVPDPTYPYIVVTNASYHYLELGIQDGSSTMTARRVDGAVIDTATVTHGPINTPPLASAGPDQTVIDADGNGAESVSLNGANSYDPDGSISSYAWTDGGITIATGATPTVTLSVGTHTLTLAVTDNLGATATDQVVVTVEPSSGLPGAFSLLSPSNRAKQASTTPLFDWSDSAGADSYTLVVSTSSNLASPVINQAGLTSSSYSSGTRLGSRTKYYWRVTAVTATGSVRSSIFSFTTGR
jgi:calcineurin-like phosphoesterase family protein/K319-like protein/purple acid phosphatase-like protein